MKKISIDGWNFFYKIIEFGAISDYITRFYFDNPKVYNFWLFKHKNYKYAFKVNVDIESDLYNKSDIRKFIRKEISNLERKQQRQKEIKKGEII